MADQFVQVPADSTGKKIDTSELTVGANTVERQRVVVGDPTSATALAAVKAASTAAAATDPALVVAVSPNNTIPVSAASLPLPAGAALDATLTGGTQQSKVTDGTNIATVKAASTAAVAADKALVVAVSPNNTIPVSATSLPLPTGAAQDATLTGGTQQTKITDGTNIATVKAASTAPVAADKALVVALSPNLGVVQGAANTVANGWPVKLTDGTNTMPTMDVAARKGFVQLTDGTRAALVDPSAGALRASLRPWEVVGAYAMYLESGALTGVGAGAPVWSLRYTGAGLCVPTIVTMNWQVSTSFTTGQILDLKLFVARSFTASDSTGNAATLTGNNGKYRTSHATTAVGDMRIAATGALTAGTRTLDTQPISGNACWAAGAGSNNDATALAGANSLYEYSRQIYPLVLANNEGLVINNVTAMGAAGVIRLSVLVEWVELASGAI